MDRFVQTWTAIAALVTLAAAPAAAQSPPTPAPPGSATQPQNEAAVKRDLTAVILLQGQPCGEVVSLTRLGDNDYVASCSDGSRYRVFVTGGRVVVQKQ
jgi:hypothetical protein